MSRVLVIGSNDQISRKIGDALSAADVPLEFSPGHADALQRLRTRSFGVVITSPESTVEEDLALEEMRSIRPGVKSIALARQSNPDEVIAALRARVFACFTPPFDVDEIANLARSAASDSQWRDDLQVLSAKPGWVSLRVNCRLITAERLMTFAKELSVQLPTTIREEMLQALREILLNAMEHGAAFNPEQVVEVTAVRTGRAMVFYLRDPGAGFRLESLASTCPRRCGVTFRKFYSQTGNCLSRAGEKTARSSHGSWTAPKKLRASRCYLRNARRGDATAPVRVHTIR